LASSEITFYCKNSSHCTSGYTGKSLSTAQAVAGIVTDAVYSYIWRCEMSFCGLVHQKEVSLLFYDYG